MSAPEPSMAPPRSFTTTLAPSEAKSNACSRPMPRPPPVMMATLSCNINSDDTDSEDTVSTVLSVHGHDGGAAQTQVVLEADGRTGDLPLVRLAPELPRELGALGQPG